MEELESGLFVLTAKNEWENYSESQCQKASFAAGVMI